MMTLPKQILVPTDLGETAERAAELAFELARPLGAHVHLLHAYGVPPFPDGAARAGSVVDDVARAAASALEPVANRYRARPELGQVLLEMGDPRELVLRAARELGADLIVMGTHGRHGMKRLLLGSVAESVVRSALCPVLVVRPEDHAPVAARDASPSRLPP